MAEVNAHSALPVMFPGGCWISRDLRVGECVYSQHCSVSRESHTQPILLPLSSITSKVLRRASLNHTRFYSKYNFDMFNFTSLPLLSQSRSASPAPSCPPSPSAALEQWIMDVEDLQDALSLASNASSTTKRVLLSFSDGKYPLERVLTVNAFC